MANRSPDTGNSVESTAIIEIQESTESTTTQESSDSGMAAAQDMVETSRTEISKTSIDSEKSEKSTATVKLQESSGRATVQDMVGPSRTETPEKSDTTQTEEGMKTTETTADPQSEGSQMDGESVPLNSRTGALMLAQDLSLTSPSSLQWLWSLVFYYPSQILEYFCSWVPGQASQTQDDETDKNLCNAKTEVMEMRNLPCDAGSNDHVDTEPFEIIEAEDVTEGKSFKQNIDKIGEIIRRTYSMCLLYFPTHHKVGIFSRSSESEYKWLTSVLQSQPFHSTVLTVRPHYISNNGRLQFMEAVSQCTFGILYHTRNRGRINIVDVTDSLYDEELKYMSEHLGKGNVIVVVDDLEDTSDKERTRILDAQPSIRELAKDIILFNAAEKKKL